MFQRVVLGLAGQPLVRGAVTGHDWLQPLVRRFVAGDERADLLRVGSELAERGLRLTADYLGEAVQDAAGAQAAAAEYLGLLDDLAAHKLEPNISLKLSQLGLDQDPQLCCGLLEQVAARAAQHGGFVRIDMESSAYTTRTLAVFGSIFPKYSNLGVVIQSSLRRSRGDLARLIAARARVRLVKGAYQEPPSVAFASKREVDRNYEYLMARLLAEGVYPAIATHDEALIDRAVDLAQQHGRTAEQFEFQMLFGVRRDLHHSLVSAGFRVRIYVPFGNAWYPYLARRLAERPDNLLFLLRNVVAEARGKRAA